MDLFRNSEGKGYVAEGAAVSDSAAVTAQEATTGRAPNMGIPAATSLQANRNLFGRKTRLCCVVHLCDATRRRSPWRVSANRRPASNPTGLGHCPQGPTDQNVR